MEFHSCRPDGAANFEAFLRFFKNFITRHNKMILNNEWETNKKGVVIE
jgi:hypothetical protein